MAAANNSFAGTFLNNSFIERSEHLGKSTGSIWEWVEHNYAQFVNPQYQQYTEVGSCVQLAG